MRIEHNCIGRQGPGKKNTALEGKVSHVGKLDIFCMTHQCHDVICKIPSQVRSHKTREASEGNTGVILVRATEILEKKKE